MANSGSSQAVVIGVSAGGLDALETILSPLPESYGLAIIIVQHRLNNGDDFLARHLNSICNLRVREAEDKQPVSGGYVYIAPPGYHLLLEFEQIFSLSLDSPVNWSRPSIDVLFETAAEAYQHRLVGIVLTGANKDGSQGLAKIKKLGGRTVVQDPQDAFASQMPLSAINKACPEHVLTLSEIGNFLLKLNK